MADGTKRIVIAGDVTVDWLMYPVEAQDEGENWRLFAGMHSRPLPGGALLLHRFLLPALEALCPPAMPFEVCAPVLPANLGALSPEDIIHSNVMVKAVGKGDSKTYRVERMLGYMGPAKGNPRLFPLKPVPDPDTADIVVLDDPGNGFRCDPGSWPAALFNAQDSLVIYKMSRPLTKGALWTEIQQTLGLKNLVVIVNADDLRQERGVKLSKSLSWERTAADFLFYLYRSERLAILQACPCLVVLCGTEGAILYFGGEEPRATLIFDPRSLEDLQASRLDGRMMGLTGLFTATLTAELAACGLPGLESGIKRGLWEARTLLKTGYTGFPGKIDYPFDRLFSKIEEKLPFATAPLSRPEDLRSPDPRFWRILDLKTRHTRPLVATQIIRKKEAPGLAEVPMGVFGKLETIDRQEIESYSAIRELLKEFLADPQPKHPLCFAVFGPPGSGKSFGVKQVVQSLGDKRLEIMTFNISQFRQYQNLVAAFHKLRDVVLDGKVPLVLFDEFDCAWEGQPLGWLKYFLAPMQDGEFSDGDSTYHLGKTVLVFIGGTRHTYEDFTRELRQIEPSASGQKDTFRDLKGPDFVSRLRGFINIMGPNCQNPEDEAYVLRRAKVLRAILRLNSKAADLFDTHGDLPVNRLDSGVLRAFLHVSHYRHGTRSLEAIIEMSRLANKRRFDLAALPPQDQLDQHVDSAEFMWLTERERFQSLLSRRDLDSGGEKWHWRREDELIEQAARLLHQDYLRRRQMEGKTGDTKVPFDDLPEDKKKSNRDAAEDIPHKLKTIEHGLRRIPGGKTARPPDIADDEVLRLARMEHERWCREQRLQGYCYGEHKDLVCKTHPLLIPFEQLSDEAKQYNIESIYAIPWVLQELGFEVYRLKEAQELADPYLLEKLARLIHQNYVKERTAEGQTAAVNPLLVDFDELPDDIKETNLDQARSIPAKLRRRGYDLRRPGWGAAPAPLNLSEEDIEEMAKMEHARWNWQKILQGWIFGQERDNVKKTHPCLVPWDKLPEKVKDYDRRTVRLIPQFLEKARYEAYKPTGVC
jgi:hypothetical protein